METEFNTYLNNIKRHITNLKLKNTVQKDYILKVLFFSKKHLTVKDITLQIKKQYNLNIGIATVYKTIKFFEELKLVTSLEIDEKPKLYELNTSIHHDHLICTKCLKIIEFVDVNLEEAQLRIAKKYNFILNNHIMTIYGLCSNCQ